MRKFEISTIIISLGMMLMLSGCTSEASNVARAESLNEEEIQELNDSVAVQSSYYYLPVGTYDSADTAILKSVDEGAGTVTLYNTVAAKSYTLNYDGTTYVSDKYGTGMSMAQLSEGTIVNVNFFKATKQLVDIQVSPDAWSYEDITKYDLGGLNSTAVIGDRTYALTKGVQVFSQGAQTDLFNIVNGDALTVSGIGYDIYSIKVDSGHGYIRLSNDEALVGGWVEIGNELITQVTEPGMLLAVPEGSYTVRMYNDNSQTSQDVLVDRNQEVVLDCAEIIAPVDTFGRILFHVNPETATLLLDGEPQDINGIVKAEYGIHEIEVSASGYDTLNRYISVGSDLAEITINLDASVAYVSDNSSSTTEYSDDTETRDDTTKKSVSSNTASDNISSVSGNSSKNDTKTTSGNKVYIYSPTDVEVYLDGIYVGLSPTNFKKTVGSHTLILKKSGYETRSYTIYCYDDGNDMSISFSELEKIKDSNDNSSTGNNSDKTDNKDNTQKKDDTDKDKNTSTEDPADDDENSGNNSQSGDEDKKSEAGEDEKKSDGEDSKEKEEESSKTENNDETGNNEGRPKDENPNTPEGVAAPVKLAN